MRAFFWINHDNLPDTRTICTIFENVQCFTKMHCPGIRIFCDTLFMKNRYNMAGIIPGSWEPASEGENI